MNKHLTRHVEEVIASQWIKMVPLGEPRCTLFVWCYLYGESGAARCVHDCCCARA